MHHALQLFNIYFRSLKDEHVCVCVCVFHFWNMMLFREDGRDPVLLSEGL